MNNVYLQQPITYNPQYHLPAIPQYQTAYRPAPQPGLPAPGQAGAFGFELTRQDKANQIASQLVPTALLTGLEGWQSARAFGALAAGESVSTAAGTSALTSATSSATPLLGTAVSGLSILGGVFGAMDLAMNWGKSTPARGAASGAAVGAAIGTCIFPGVGTAVGAALGMIGGGLIGAINTGKHKDQVVRDQVRDMLVQANVLDANFGLTLADGTIYDMGRDGGKKSDLGGFRPFEVDLSRPMVNEAIGWVDPLADLLFPGMPKVKTDFAGYFANAVLSNAKDLNDVRANVAALMQRLGLNNDQLAQAIIQRTQMGQMPVHLAQAYLNGINQRLDLSFQPRAQTELSPTEALETEQTTVAV